jgi:hypothetical protein
MVMKNNTCQNMLFFMTMFGKNYHIFVTLFFTLSDILITALLEKSIIVLAIILAIAISLEPMICYLSIYENNRKLGSCICAWD